MRPERRTTTACAQDGELVTATPAGYSAWHVHIEVRIIAVSYRPHRVFSLQ
jgi:hypothetical protein